MFKRNTVAALILGAFVFASLLLLSAAGAQRSSDQPTTRMTLGGAIKGVDVKLTRYGGAQFSSGSMGTFRMTTNEKGEFKFPVVPKGEYLLTVEVAEKVRADYGIGALGGTGYITGKSGPDGKIDSLLVTISDASGKRGIGWDLARNQAFDPLVLDSTKQSTARTTDQKKPNIVVSDGATPCNGAINTSRSNIKSL